MLPTSAWRTTASDNPASDDWTVPANQHPLVQERTEPEFVNLVIDEMIRRHAEVGAALLETLGAQKEAIDAARDHVHAPNRMTRTTGIVCLAWELAHGCGHTHPRRGHRFDAELLCRRLGVQIEHVRAIAEDAVAGRRAA